MRLHRYPVAGQANINTTAGSVLQLAAEDPTYGTSLQDAVSLSGSVMTCLLTGPYRIDVGYSYTDATSRGNPQGRIQISTNSGASWADHPYLGSMGYVRNATGHQTSSIEFSDVISLNQGDQVRIFTQQEAGAGVMPLTAGHGRVLVEFRGDLLDDPLSLGPTYWNDLLASL